MKSGPGVELIVFCLRAFLLGVIVYAAVWAAVSVFLEIRANSGDTLGAAFMRFIGGATAAQNMDL